MSDEKIFVVMRAREELSNIIISDLQSWENNQKDLNFSEAQSLILVTMSEILFSLYYGAYGEEKFPECLERINKLGKIFLDHQTKRKEK